MKTSADKAAHRAVDYIVKNGKAARTDEWVLGWSNETVHNGMAIVTKIDDGMVLSLEHEHFNLSPVLVTKSGVYRRVRTPGKSEWMELENGDKLLQSIWSYFNQMRQAVADSKR